MAENTAGGPEVGRGESEDAADLGEPGGRGAFQVLESISDVI